MNLYNTPPHHLSLPTSGRRAFLLGAATWTMVGSIHPAFAKLQDWSSVIAKVRRYVVRLELTSAARIVAPRSASGFVVDRTGLVLTNDHVVAAGDQIEAIFNDGRRCSTQILDRQPLIDLALLRVNGLAATAPGLVFADIRTARIGHPVLALGSPLRYPFSASAGILSAFDRYYSDQDAILLLQHDAALNPGNSGGPLLDRAGRVLGINTATPPETEYDIGISFAVPADVAAFYVQQVVRHGRYRYSALGLRVRRIGPQLAALLKTDSDQGLLIEQVAPNSAAANASLQSGDVILGIDGVPLSRGIDLARLLWRRAPGSTLRLLLEREGRRRDVQIETREAIVGPPTASRFEKGRSGLVPSASFGLSLRDTPLAGGASVVTISTVEAESAAARAGLQSGDVLLEINRRGITDAPAALALLRAAAESSDALLLVARPQGEQQYVLLSQSESSPAARDDILGATY